MSHRAVEVEPILRPYVQRVVIQTDCGDDPGHDAAYRVLPGLNPVIGFQFQGRLDVLRDGQTQTLDRSGVTGLLSGVRLIAPRDAAGSILVYLRPEGAYALLGGSMDEIADQHVSLACLGLGAVAREFDERLIDMAAPDQRSSLVQRFLVGLLERSGRPPHPVVVEAARRIVQRHGTERLHDLANDLGVGARHLERLFLAQIGVSPKRLASLAQFDWARARIADRSWARLADEAGYADQSHFSRSFRAYSGVTPSQYRTDPSEG